MKNYLGQKVMMKSNEPHFENPSYFPTMDKIGEVVGQKTYPLEFMLLVEWPSGSTSESDIWFVGLNQVKFVDE